MARIRRIDSQKELDRLIDEFITRGFTLKSRGESNARLKKKDWGDPTTHVIIGVLSFWWSLGLTNALYAIYKRVTAEEVVIKIDDTQN
jgi:hypothetical protein